MNIFQELSLLRAVADSDIRDFFAQYFDLSEDKLGSELDYWTRPPGEISVGFSVAHGRLDNHTLVTFVREPELSGREMVSLGIAAAKRFFTEVAIASMLDDSEISEHYLVITPEGTVFDAVGGSYGGVFEVTKLAQIEPPWPDSFG